MDAPEFRLLRQLFSSPSRTDMVYLLLRYGEVSTKQAAQLTGKSSDDVLHHFRILHQTHWCLSKTESQPFCFHIEPAQRTRLRIALEQLLQWVNDLSVELDYHYIGELTLNPLYAAAQHEHSYRALLWLASMFPHYDDVEHITKAVDSYVVKVMLRHLNRLMDGGLLYQAEGKFRLASDCSLVKTEAALTDLLALATKP